jgi:guanylate kinase
MDITIGAPLININSKRHDNKFLLLDMGVKGAMEFKKNFKNAIFIYIIPPTIERLFDQMKDRNPSRLQRSKAQLSVASDVCDWLVINDDVEIAATQIEKIMHTIRDNYHNLDGIDEETMRFLYSCNFHNPKNKEFLERFYGEDVSYPKEIEL